MVNRLKDNQMRSYKLGVNAVGGKGQKNLDHSKADFQYAEIWSNSWDWDDNAAGQNKVGRHNTYADLGRVVDNAVLLKDISVLMNGGNVMELADDANQIYNEYYTGVSKNKEITMSRQLGDPDSGKLRKLYDFMTAYENVLRGDSLQNNYHRIEIMDSNGKPLADRDGNPGSVYTVTKSGHDGYHDIETINMLNLTDVTNSNWQIRNKADEASKVVKTKKNLKVKYYVDPYRRIDKLWMASPDREDGRSQTLDFKRSWDEHGDYIEFTVPSLEYWNLIYMKG